MQFAPARNGSGWRLTLPWDGDQKLYLDVVGAHVVWGAVRAALTIRIGDVIVDRTTLSLTAARARAQLRSRLAARWIFLEEGALIALDEVCRVREPRSEPPQPVGVQAQALASVLDDLDLMVGRYVVFRSLAQRTAVVLWIAHTHVLEAFDVTPYLYIHSPEKRSGKSRLQEVLNELVPRPELTSRLTEAATFRLIESDNGAPVLLIDEVDTIFGGKPDERTEALRALLNAGWRRGLSIPRCVGPTHEVHRFPTFCAKALSGIGRPRAALPDTIADRSIPIVLARRKKTEPVEKFRVRTTPPQLHPLRDALKAWAPTALAALRAARPVMPDLHDRAEDIWEPFMAIADLAGAEWPARALAAAVELSGGESDGQSTGVQLLRAIKEVFAERRTEKMLTIDLLPALVARETEPWPGWWGKEVDQAKEGVTPKAAAMDLARHLRPFGVMPKTVRVPDGRKDRGYDLADFMDAFARYIPDPEVDLCRCAAAVAEYVRCCQECERGRDDETTLAAQGFEASRLHADKTEVETPELLRREGWSWRLDLETLDSSRWQKAALEGGRAGSGRPAAGAPDVGRDPLFIAARHAGFPWLRLRPGYAVARGEDGWRLFCETATVADREVARLLLTQGEGLT